MEAKPRTKIVKVEDKEYQVDFDGRFADVSEVISAPSSFGWSYPYQTKVTAKERAMAIYAAGKYFSRSKWWAWEYKMAGNEIAGL